jgi:hypothetical protein
MTETPAGRAVSLVQKYRPRGLPGLLGQPWVAHQLQLFCECPCPCAFPFEGETGTGKTSAALLLAGALGVCVAEGHFGGLYQIASGEQTGETVRSVLASLHCRPFFGSGWRVLVVNEVDAMTPGAAVVWLDALEDLPTQSVIVFTTNDPGRIPARLRDRCERLRCSCGGSGRGSGVTGAGSRSSSRKRSASRCPNWALAESVARRTRTSPDNYPRLAVISVCQDGSYGRCPARVPSCLKEVATLGPELCLSSCDPQPAFPRRAL